MPSSRSGRPDREACADCSTPSDPSAPLPIHAHDSTGDAYDASNCRNDHRFAILLIERERVVGLAWAWPIAVTERSGALHYPSPDTDIPALLADAGYDEDDARQAVAVATEHGFPVRAEFCRFL